MIFPVAAAASLAGRRFPILRQFLGDSIGFGWNIRARLASAGDTMMEMSHVPPFLADTSRRMSGSMDGSTPAGPNGTTDPQSGSGPDATGSTTGETTGEQTGTTPPPGQ